MVGDGAAQNYPIPGPGMVAGNLDLRRYQTEPGGIDKNFVHRTAGNNLGIPRDNSNVRVFSSLAHFTDNRLQIGHRKALFDNQTGTQVQRLRTAHCNIVDSPVNGQIADVSSREKNRVHCVGIG